MRRKEYNGNIVRVLMSWLRKTAANETSSLFYPNIVCNIQYIQMQKKNRDMIAAGKGRDAGMPQHQLQHKYCNIMAKGVSNILIIQIQF